MPGACPGPLHWDSTTCPAGVTDGAGGFRAKPCARCGKALSCAGCVCLKSPGEGRVAGCALGGLTLYWEGGVAGNQNPGGMQVAVAEQLPWHSAVCWDKTKINLAF